MRSGRLYALAALWEQYGEDYSNSGSSPLAGHEAKRIVMDDAKGLRRRAENLRALAKKARDDHYIQLADYIRHKADQLFEEARIRELDDPTPIDKIAIWPLRFAMSEKPPAFRFSVYRSDVHAGESMVVAEERYNTIAEVLSHPYQPDEEYLIRLDGLRRRRWLSREEFKVWASQQETE
jgi:hypothetical protein